MSTKIGAGSFRGFSQRPVFNNKEEGLGQIMQRFFREGGRAHLIDGLDPVLCPNTGTSMPGADPSLNNKLSWYKLFMRGDRT